MHSEYGGYNLVSKGCGVVVLAIIAAIFGMAVGTPIAIALAW